MCTTVSQREQNFVLSKAIICCSMILEDENATNDLHYSTNSI